VLGPSIQVDLLPAHGSPPNSVFTVHYSEAFDLQNRMLYYRLQNRHRVEASSFDALNFSSDMRAVVRALGSSIVDDAKLQAALIDLLAPEDQHVREQRAGTLQALVVEAVLRLCHEGKKLSAHVQDIADMVNRMYVERGDHLRASAEVVGHTMKKLRLFTRRLSGGNRGLELGKEVQQTVHELADKYGVFSMLDKDPQCVYCQLLK
jgi:hypothetical protein